jgi:hypothetical protein
MIRRPPTSTRSTPSTRSVARTGGTTCAWPPGGLGIGLVTKRGTNNFHGSAGINFAHDDLQWSNLQDELHGDPRLQGSDKADHTDQINDYAFDIGGPILKDKLWFYGSYGKNDIRVRRLNQTPDKTLLTNYSAKLNWQAAPSDTISAFWFLGDKTKEARRAVNGSPRPLRARLEPGVATSSGPPGFSAGVEPHLAQLFFNLKGAYYNQGFCLCSRVAGPAVHRDNIHSESRQWRTSACSCGRSTRSTARGRISPPPRRQPRGPLRGGWRRVDPRARHLPGGIQVRYNPTSTRVASTARASPARSRPRRATCPTASPRTA